MKERRCQPRIDLYVESLCPTGNHQRQKAVIERLNAMEDRGRIAGFSVDVWGNRIPCDERTSVGESILERIEAIKAWSDSAGTSLSPFFGTSEADSMLTEETRTTVDLPVLCLVEYHDDDIAFVAPCSEDGKVCTIADRLDALDAREVQHVS
jgi:hypothetical protein